MKYTCQNMLKHPMRSIFLDLCGPEFGHTPTRCIEATQWMQATMPARYLHVSSNLPVYHVEWNKMNQWPFHIPAFFWFFNRFTSLSTFLSLCLSLETSADSDHLSVFSSLIWGIVKPEERRDEHVQHAPRPVEAAVPCAELGFAVELFGKALC